MAAKRVPTSTKNHPPVTPHPLWKPSEVALKMPPLVGRDAFALGLEKPCVTGVLRAIGILVPGPHNEIPTTTLHYRMPSSIMNAVG